MSHLQRLAGCVEEHVSIHPNVETIANRNLDRWLDIEITPGHFDAQFTQLLTHRRRRGFLGCWRGQ